MIGLLNRLTRPFLHALDPEDAHGLAIKMLKFAPLPPAPRDDKRLALRVFGLNFPNPVGIEPEQPRPRIARLRQRRDGSDFDKAEA